MTVNNFTSNLFYMPLFQKFDILRELDQVREALIYIIGQSIKLWWNEDREIQFIELSQKEIELSQSLIA